jgi:hypothetical protein
MTSRGIRRSLRAVALAAVLAVAGLAAPAVGVLAAGSQPLGARIAVLAGEEFVQEIESVGAADSAPAAGGTATTDATEFVQ